MQRTGIGLGVGLVGALVAWGCAEADGGAGGPGPGTTDGIGDTDFVSSVAPGGLTAPGGDTPGNIGGVSAPSPVMQSGDDPSTALAEADMVELSGDRLYALSRYRGLSIIDVSNPTAPSLLGEHRVEARATQMYVEDGVVYAMFSDWSTYRCEDDARACGWVGSGRLQALDTRDPASIQVLAEIELGDAVDDSRRIGDVLYLTTHRPGAGTTLTSFDLSGRGLTQLAQLQLPAAEGRRVSSPQIVATEQRLYVAGLEYDTGIEEFVPSSVQVVDISGGAGTLELGARFELAGAITHPWQMDEHDGVLRVITPMGAWGTNGQPVIETFRVSSSDDVQPLGSLAVQLESTHAALNGARFDGPRGFSLIADSNAGLLTFDLSDPANPLQVGELGLSSEAHHMELREGRLFVLGSNLYNLDGMLDLSMFDVEDLAEPRLLGKVAFGEGFTGRSNVITHVAETFSVLPDQNLILVPYGGNDFFEPCADTLGSGVQLIDFTDTALTRRGVAPQLGFAQRALLHEGHLFGVGDNAVQAFDIANRDQPVARGRLEFVRSASALRAIDDRVVRLGTDWSTGRSTLDSTWLGRARDAVPEAELDLSAIAASSCGGDSRWTGQIFMQGSFAYLPHRRELVGSETAASAPELALHVLDLTDRAAPRFAGQVAVHAATGESFASILQTDGALLIGRRGPGGDSYDILDLSDPSAPVLASRFDVPDTLANQDGVSLSAQLSCTGDRGCNAELSDGDIVVRQHAVRVQGSSTQVKYYLDRIDVSDPHAPRLLPSINVPGVVIHFDSTSGTLVTRDLQERVVPVRSSDECYGRGIASPSGDSCRVFPIQLNTLQLDGDRAVRSSRVELDHERWTHSMAVSDSRVFYLAADRERPLSEWTRPEHQSEVTTLMLESVDFQSGRLVQLPSQPLRQLPRNQFLYRGTLYARGERAFELFGPALTVIDTHDPAAPRGLSHGLPLDWFETCQSLELSGDEAYCAAGGRRPGHRPELDALSEPESGASGSTPRAPVPWARGSGALSDGRTAACQRGASWVWRGAPARADVCQLPALGTDPFVPLRDAPKSSKAFGNVAGTGALTGWPMRCNAAGSWRDCTLL